MTRDGFRSRRIASAIAALTLVTSALIGIAEAPARAAVDPCGASGNPVACENSKPGTDPSVWDIDGAGDSSIQGYATDISVNAGSRVDFKIKTPARAYTIDIYRTGYYQGLGARKIASVTPSAVLPQTQPQCLTDATTELYDCGNWGVSASWSVPSTAVSGVYIALLHRTDTGGESHIIFVVRNDSSRSQVVFQTSDPTWEAYNSYGGSDFYQGAANGRAYKISYNRPFATREGTTQRDFYFSSEYAMVRFLEKNGYDVSYVAGVDTDRAGALLRNHNVFLSVGHDEYWSAAQRANIQAARDAGVNIQFLSGNEGYWHTRYEPSTVDGGTNRYRTLVSYKETWGNAKIDPSAEWTGTWRDPRFASQANGAGVPENALTGTMYMSNNDYLPVTVSSAEGKLRIWRNTSLASLAPGASAQLAANTVGYESDEDVDNGFRPAGLIRMSTTTGSTPQYLRDYGNVVTPGTTTHHITMYRAASGAKVFSAGSIQWTWGLDQTHDGGQSSPADSRMIQAQVNLLADMGAQPVTLASGLVASTASSDTTAPTVTISSPVNGATIANGTKVTVTGTASDVGGVVAGVEVSTDGGATYHPATGTTSWSYSYSQHGTGTQSIRVRAIDDSGNYPSTPASVSVTTTAPYSVFGADVPQVVDAGDGSSVELGLAFSPSVNGYVSGVRFYKSAANTGSHTGSLWSSTGQRLASIVFSGESASGWQQALFSAPVSVTAGTTYTVSYTAPQGHYSADPYYWPYSAAASPPLTVATGFNTPTPGLYGDPGTAPTKVFNSSNYYVDVVFDTVNTTPLTVTSQWPTASSTSVPTSTPVTAQLSTDPRAGTVAMTLKTVQGAGVAGTVTYDSASRTATLTPSAALAANTSYTATVTATSASGGGITSGGSWTFTTAASGTEPTCPCSIMAANAVPSTLRVPDNPVTLGVTFQARTTGGIAGLKFYKGTGNTGTHVGTLYSATGTQLATVTFTNESASGWQTAYFSSVVPVTAGKQYVAAYTSPTGSYSADASGYSSAKVNGPLAVPASGGAYSYQGGFPSSASATNYYADVVFVTDGKIPAGPLAVSSHSPDTSATGVSPSVSITAVLSRDPGTPVPSVSVTGPAGAVTGTTSYDSPSKTLTFKPTSVLAWSTNYSVVISSGSTALGGGSWSFTTSAQPPADGVYNLITTAPATPSSDDTSAVEVGMAFTTSTAGTVTAIRFYKGSGNTGTHKGTLWDSSGTKLATVTFTGESASGWQSAALAAPYSLTPGQRYVVSYLAPKGHYSYTTGGFSSLVQNGPLAADTSNNGRYLYASAGGFPTSSYGASNYFVDIAFKANGSTAPPATLVSTVPAAGATGVQPTTAVSATLSGPSAAGTPVLSLTGPSGDVAGTAAYDSSSYTASFQPGSALAWATTYTATLSVGGAVPDGGTWTFTTAAQPLPSANYSLFDASTVPTGTTSDGSPVEVGLGFAVSQPGSVTAVRFYKGTGNTGTHTGSLWTAAGQRLATVTFAGESSSGWQTAILATPYALTPGTRYVVSYFAPNGHYSTTPGYFSTARSSGPISADVNDNGTFAYGASGGFPAGTYASTNYFVDLVFSTGSAASTPGPSSSVSVTQTSPASGATGVAPTASVSATVTGSGAAGTVLTLTGPGGPVDAPSSYSASSGAVTATPSSPLAWSTTYTATVSSGGAAVSGGTWSFTTAAAPANMAIQTLFPDSAVPQNPAYDDSSQVQVATRFSASAAGTISGIRFYKGSANTGTHTGYLWTATGDQLATVAFTGETDSGWQTAQLSTPVTIQPGVEYRVGLLSSTGHYAVDVNGLQNPLTSGDLSTPAQGAAYSLGADFPSTLSNHNYWVDVLFRRTP